VSARRIDVLYVGGFFRSGSTLLDRILGSIDGFFSIGEARFIWDECFGQNQPCGCGSLFKECGFWQRVVEQAYGHLDSIDLGRIRRLKRAVDRMRYIPLLITNWRIGMHRRSYRDYGVVLTKLYSAIQSVSGARVIVDSSKDPSYAYLLNSLPNINLYVVHLIRDSRAVAYSWRRKKVKYHIGENTVYMPQHGPVKSSFGWVRHNILLEPLGFRNPNYIRIRYEDFMDDPHEVLHDILSLVRQQAKAFPLAPGECTVKLGVNHTVAGNPMRFKTGPVELRTDNEWKARMADIDRRIVTMLTWPLLMKYGYLSTG